jgi:hypothetical protein
MRFRIQNPLVQRKELLVREEKIKILQATDNGRNEVHGLERREGTHVSARK